MIEIAECECGEIFSPYICHPQFVCPNCGGMIEQPSPPRFLGWEISDVVARMPEGWKYRIVKLNGGAIIVTRDHDERRLNFEVERGVVTYQYVG